MSLRMLCVFLLALASWHVVEAGEVSTADAAGSAAGFGHYEPTKLYTEQVSSTFYLPMRDGVRLAVRVARPARAGQAVAGRFPVLWHHTLSVTQETVDGTGPRAGGYHTLPRLTDYGYVVVQVARRGNGQSFGVRRGYHDRSEAYDAYEITEWLAQQPWSDGNVGIYGCSNTGDAAMHAVSARPPHLKAAFAGCFSWSKYDAMRRGGVFAQWGTGPQRTLAQDTAIDPVDADADKLLLQQAAVEHQQSTVLYDMWKGMPYRDSYSALVGSRFWAEGSVSSYADQIRRSGVAIYIQGAWRDEFRDQAITTFLNVPGARVLIGPWRHCENPGFALAAEIHRFFDTVLKGRDTGLQREPPIHYYTVNAPPGSQWRATATWPLKGAGSRRMYLGKPGHLQTGAPGGSASQSFRVETQISCPDAGSGSTVQPCHVPGSGLSYTGEVLRSDTEVTGDPVMAVRLSVDRNDADVFAYLEDVDPAGGVSVVTEGRLRASLRKLAAAPYQLPGVPWHRAYAEDVQLLAPGQVVTLRFAMLPTSYVFRQGHRLQVTVTGADPRQRDRDPSAQGANITLNPDLPAASSIDLPVVPGGT